MQTPPDRAAKPVLEVLDVLDVFAVRDPQIAALLVHDLDTAIDEVTYPVLSGLDRLGNRTSAQLAGELGLDRSVVSRHASPIARQRGRVRQVEIMHSRLPAEFDR